MISPEKWKILTPLQKLPKNVGDLGKLIVAKGFKSCPKSNKLPNLVTLLPIELFYVSKTERNAFLSICESRALFFLW